MRREWFFSAILAVENGQKQFGKEFVLLPLELLKPYETIKTIIYL